jgi:hypothetical protein
MCRLFIVLAAVVAAASLALVAAGPASAKTVHDDGLRVIQVG